MVFRLHQGHARELCVLTALSVSQPLMRLHFSHAITRSCSYFIHIIVATVFNLQYLPCMIEEADGGELGLWRFDRRE